MPAAADVSHFLERIMHMNVLRLDAFADIGSTSADHDILHNLKKSAIAFAGEYRKPASDQAELARLSGEIEGCLRTLQLNYALSEKEADKLIDELQMLEESPYKNGRQKKA